MGYNLRLRSYQAWPGFRAAGELLGPEPNTSKNILRTLRIRALKQIGFGSGLDPCHGEPVRIRV